MKKPSSTWLKLVELAEIEMDNAAKTFAMMRQQESSDASQLDSLREYQADYNQKGIKANQSLSQLNTYRLFADKLSQAIEAQEQKLQQSVQMVEKAQEAWFEKRARFKALEQLLQKKQNDYEYRLSQQEQKMLDELASQQSARKHS